MAKTTKGPAGRSHAARLKVSGSEANLKLRRLERLLREAAAVVGDLDGHGGGCACPFCRDLADDGGVRLPDDLAGFRWFLGHALCVVAEYTHMTPDELAAIRRTPA